MLYSQSPPLTADEMAFDGLARDLGVHTDQRVARRRPKPAADSSYSYRFGEGQPVPRSRPSIGRRMFRTLIRFTITVLIGVGATLGWQSYGDEIREMLIAQAPAVGMLLPVPSTRPPVSTAAYGDPTRQLAPMASTLDAVRRSVEQLAAKQEQMRRTSWRCGLSRRRSGKNCCRHLRPHAGTGTDPTPAGRLGPAAQAAASQDELSPVASARIAVLALTAQHAKMDLIAAPPGRRR